MVYIFVPGDTKTEIKIIIFLSCLIAVIISLLVMLEHENQKLKGKNQKLKDENNELSQKHLAICKQYDEKKKILIMYQISFANLNMAVDMAEEQLKGNRHNYVYNIIKSMATGINSMEENSNGKQQ